MIVMCANQNGLEFGRLCGLFPGQLGHLYSPGDQRGPYKWMPYSLDNGAFKTFKSGQPFDDISFFTLLYWARMSSVPPRWVLVPDVVADPKATLESWRKYADRVAEFGWSLAFAAQDGHTVNDIPSDAEVVFIGGTTEWKRKNIRPFCDAFPRVHVGRINTYKWLDRCARAGAESVDGTGFFRGDQAQLYGLIAFLEEQNGTHRHPVQKSMFAAVRNCVADRSRSCACRSRGQGVLHG